MNDETSPLDYAPVVAIGGTIIVAVILALNPAVREPAAKPLTDTQRIERLEQACFGKVMDTATDEEVQKVVQEIDDKVADEQSRLRKVEKHVDQNSERLLKLEARKNK